MLVKVLGLSLVIVDPLLGLAKAVERLTLNKIEIHLPPESVPVITGNQIPGKAPLTINGLEAAGFAAAAFVTDYLLRHKFRKRLREKLIPRPVMPA
jgi:hypothetical protein